MLSIFKNKISVFVLLLAFGSAGCKKLVEVDPPVTSTTGASIYTDDVTATTVLTRLYASLSGTAYNSTSGLSTPFSKKAGLSADELSLWSGAGTSDIAYYTNTLAAPAIGSGGITAGNETWTTCFGFIYTCNAAIEGLNAATTLTPSVKQQLLGEAKFMRAFYYFYLVNLYGDIPLALSSDYRINNSLLRSPKAQVYLQMIADLKDAQTSLSSTYLNGQLKSYTSPVIPERVRPTSWAATALLARVYLYTGDWAGAEMQASTVINNTTLFSLSTLSNTFLKTSSGNNEAILQLQPVNTSGTSFFNSEDARLFVLSAAPAGVNSTHIVYLSPQLLSAFETGDARKTNWVTSYTDGTGTYSFPNKYKLALAGASVNEYQTVLRLGEQYLIRAEARAQQNNTSGAQGDLNMIRARAGLGVTSANTQAGLLTAISHERQVELFCEWGHRWLDLKRTGNVDAVMNAVTPLKGNTNGWKSYQQLYPLPIGDVQANPNLVQNSGY
ncbi:MAG: RagB/SusD family nutrient uptake outer membrane protein [Bacteroidota bacterium]